MCNSKLVVHCKRAKYDVYIGRPSKWGNPFPVAEHGREACIMKYRAWLWDRAQNEPELVKDLASLHGKVLGCWCDPHDCHGHVLVRASKWAVRQLTKQ